MNPNFIELLRAFIAADVRYLIVGGYALGLHGHPRATGDLDVWIEATPENAEHVMRALAAFGAPLDGISTSDFASAGQNFQIGLPPVRIDVLTTIDGVHFADAWSGRITSRVAGLQVNVIGRADFIRNKRASGRTQDRADLERIGGI